MKIKERYDHIINYFIENKPLAETELEFENPFQLLVAVILSAQCTDKRVNMVTPELFQVYGDSGKMSEADPAEVFTLIKSISYPNSKSKYLVGMAKMLQNDFSGKVPENIEDLMKLPGVGRKTANVIASVVYNKAAMAVDTHVFRVSNRLGLTSDSKSPLETEMKLMKNIPEEYISVAHHWLILHGRYVCTAKNPKCDECGLTQWCKYFEKKQKAE